MSAQVILACNAGAMTAYWRHRRRDLSPRLEAPMNLSTPAPVAAQVSVLEFPCTFPIKIMGRTQDGFAQTVVEVVRRHAPDFDAATLEMRTSSAGNYLSVTATVNATSRDQLDDLYRELVAHPMVAMVL